MMTSASIASPQRGADTAPEFQAFHQGRDRRGVAQAACSDRHCWSQNRLRTSFLEQIRLLVRGPWPSRTRRALFTPLLVADLDEAPWRRMSSASSQDASRKCVSGLAGSTLGRWNPSSHSAAAPAAWSADADDGCKSKPKAGPLTQKPVCDWRVPSRPSA